jgi:hypothetical protein
MADRFRGDQAVDPSTLCEQLGWAEGMELHEVVGAVMSLCLTVAAQQREIDRLGARVRALEAKADGK